MQQRLSMYALVIHSYHNAQASGESGAVLYTMGLNVKHGSQDVARKSVKFPFDGVHMRGICDAGQIAYDNQQLMLQPIN